MEAKSKQNLIKSIVINAVILIAMLILTDMAYETNDDYAIASRLAAGYPYVGFVNYYLCKVLIAVQRMIPARRIAWDFGLATRRAALTCETSEYRSAGAKAVHLEMIFSSGR